MVSNNIKIIAAMALLYFACTEPPSLEDNPLDPGGGEYQTPTVIINSSFTDGSTVSSATATFELTGNELVFEFRYKLNEYEWSAWSKEINVLVEFLDEGSNTFYAQSRYESLEESDIASLGFTVDAVSGPALMFYPRRHFAEQNQSVTFQIMAEEVQNLAGLEIGIGYEPSKLIIQDVSSGSLFSETGSPIFFSDISENGQVTITTAVWGDGEPAFDGTGSIAEITVRVLETGSISLEFDGTEIFRDQNNSEIEVAETVPGLVIVN